MAAGIFQGEFILTSTRTTLDALTGGTQTYGYIAIRGARGSIAMGNSSVLQTNGFKLPKDYPLVVNQSVTGATLNFIGPGVLDFFGIATA